MAKAALGPPPGPPLGPPTRLDPGESEQIGALLLDVRLIGLFFAVLVLVGCIALWNHVPRGWLIAWVAVFGVEGAIRFSVTARYRRATPERRRDPLWRTLVRAMNLYTGIVYGLTALVLLLPLPRENFVLLVCVFTGVYSLLYAASNYYWPIIYISGIPMFAPLLLALLFSGRPMLVLSACLIAFVALVIARMARHTTHALSAQIGATAENARLMEQLSEKTLVAERARGEAERAVVEKSRFIAATSHDLRQPLHAMSLFHGLLDKRCTDPDSRHLSEMTGNCIATLIHQFDSLLDMSRLDAGMVVPECEHIDAGAFVGRLIERFRGEALDGGGLAIEADVAPGAVFLADPLLLDRILSNLLSNAIDYTERGGIRIEVGGEAEGGKIALAVTDTGVGIPDGELDKVFDEYYRLREHERGAEGFGLGLAIVARLCALLDIDIDVESEVGVGTRFRLRVPAGSARQITALAPVPDESDLAGNAVLVIDDDPDILDGMRRTLEGWGCIIRTARSASDARARVARDGFEPDLLVCDYRLGREASGVATARGLRDLLGAGLPVIMITGDSSRERLSEILGSGFDVLHKPVSPMALRGAVVAALQARYQ